MPRKLRSALRTVAQDIARRVSRRVVKLGHGEGHPRFDGAGDRPLLIGNDEGRSPLVATTIRRNGTYRTISKAAGDDEVDEVDWEPVITATAEGLAIVAGDGAQQALLRLGVSEQGITDQTYATAREWAKRRAAELVGKRYTPDGALVDNDNAEMAISDTIRDEVREAVASAIDEGLSARDLAKRIEELDCFSPERAEMIARTELIRANNQGHLEAFRSAGVERKAWSTSNDGDVCDDCDGNEEQGAIDLEDDFQSGDDAAPAHPLCRCTIVAVIDEEKPEEGENEDEEAAA